MTIKTILFSGAMALGIAACHHDRDTNTPANNTYARRRRQPGPGRINSTNNLGQQREQHNKTARARTAPTTAARTPCRRHERHERQHRQRHGSHRQLGHDQGRQPGHGDRRSASSRRELRLRHGHMASRALARDQAQHLGLELLRRERLLEDRSRRR